MMIKYGVKRIYYLEGIFVDIPLKSPFLTVKRAFIKVDLMFKWTLSQ